MSGYRVGTYGAGTYGASTWSTTADLTFTAAVPYDRRWTITTATARWTVPPTAQPLTARWTITKAS